MKTLMASSPAFATIIYLAMAAVALATLILAALIVRDWRQGKLW